MEDRHLEAGAASEIITPPIGAYIAGDKQNRRFTGVHDDLYATALALRHGSKVLVFLSLDCLGLPYPDICKIRNKAIARLHGKVAPDAASILVGSTHIHNGPDIIGIYGPDPSHSGLDPEYMAFLIESASRAIARAVDGLQEARGKWSMTAAEMDWVENICEPEKLDKSFAFLALETPEGETIATLGNFACHPTLLDGIFDVVSADWVGAYRDALGEALGGEHLFFQGAIGAWVQPDKTDRGYERVLRYGRELADHALRSLETAQTFASHELDCVSEVYTIPLDNDAWRMAAEMGIIDRELMEEVATEVSVCRVGEARFATHPGETAPDFGLETKSKLGAGEGPRFLLGLTQDALGYILPERYFAPDTTLPYAEYLGRMSVGPEAENATRKALDAAIAKLV